MVVLVVGFALAGSLMGTAYYLNSSQKSLLANHALTNAQSGAWQGVEILRKYLNTLTDEELQKLDNTNINLNSLNASELRFKNVTTRVLDAEKRQYEVMATVENKSDRSQASSRLEVLFKINRNEKETTKETTVDVGVINIFGDLKVTGRVEILGDTKAIVNVQGNFTSLGNYFTGVSALMVTGNVHLKGGGENIKKIVANGDVIMDSGVADEVYAKGSITINNGRAVGNLYADKNITITNGSAQIADALGDVYMKGASIQKIIAGGDVTLANGTIGDVDARGTITLAGGSKYGTLRSLKGITFTANSASQAGDFISNGSINFGKSSLKVGNVISAGNITCTATWWTNYLMLNAKGTYTNCATANRKQMDPSYFPLKDEDIQPTGSQQTVAIMEKTMIDAYVYKGDANYIFSYDKTKANVQVTLQNLDSPLNGKTFYMGSYPNSWNDWGYLCTEVASNVCKSVPVSKITVGSGSNGDAKKIINYNNGVWELRGFSNSGKETRTPPAVPALSPGVIFFDGKVKFLEGNFVNTVLSTNNIEFSGAGTGVYAPNFVTKEYLCDRVKYPNNNYADYPYMKPINLCGTSRLKLADVALLAGSFVRNSSGVKTTEYQGGDITLATSYIYGNVIAGNRFYTKNTGHITGTLDAENLANPESVTDMSSLFDNVVDLTGIDLDKDKQEQVDDSDSSSESDVDSEPYIKWVRYS